MVDRSRFFENNLGDYDGESELIGPSNELIGKVSDDIKTFLVSHLKDLEDLYSSEIGKKKFDSSHDSSVYTGTNGIVLLSQKLTTTHNSQWSDFLPCAERLLTKSLPGKKRITFLCGDAGPYALGAIHCNNKGDEAGKNKYIEKLMKLASWSSSQKLDNEVLYGRAGYLYALLLVKCQINKDIIPDQIVGQIVDDLIDAGLKGVNRKSKFPLYFEWHDKEYIGAAHGYIGIFYMLLQVKDLCPGILKEKHDELLVSCLDNLLNQRFSSGNIRSSIGSESDRLIHWCHGAPGAIHLYALAYKIFKKSSYLSAAEGFSDNVWTRGLLRRGYGICHGVAGNGYAHLCMYQLTGNKTYLWRAVKFAEWCLLYGQHDCRIPDRPYSLFEGIAGTLYFLHDMLLPEKAMFPAFQLVSYN